MPNSAFPIYSRPLKLIFETNILVMSTFIEVKSSAKICKLRYSTHCTKANLKTIDFFTT